MNDKNRDDSPAYAENPKSGDAGPTFETEIIKSEKPKAGEGPRKTVTDSEKPKW